MSVRQLSAATTVALLGGFARGAPAAVDAGSLTIRRLVATVAALVALTGVVVGGLALARSAGRVGTGSARLGGIVAGVAGLTGTVIGGLVVVAAEGGPGSGYGIVGGYAALVIGPVAMVLGALALARARRTA
jgi:hypothetical protein